MPATAQACRAQVPVFVVLTSLASIAKAADPAVYDLGDKRELFVDRHRIESMSGSATLRLHEPRPAEVAIKFDAPWEGSSSAYVTVFRDGDKVRMYYRASGDVGKSPERQYACYAESTDGKTFTKPELGLYEAEGSKANNIVWPNRSHNFTPFKDTRPNVPADERYKALQSLTDKATRKSALFAYYSPDGIHWRKASDTPVLTGAPFDSQNLAFWDENDKQYRCYYRIFIDKTRAIALARSDDFVTWSSGEPIDLGDGKLEQFYTNATTPYFRAPQFFFAFPKRYVSKRVGKEGHQGISDTVFLSSRDGMHFDRTFGEALIRPGRDELNWGDRGTMTAWGSVQTGPDEMSVYYSQHYRYPTGHLRRGVLRLDGIASLHADGNPGELMTKPFRFTGSKLQLNYATSAAGNVQVEIQDADGTPIPGYTLKDAPETFGDKIDAAFAWKHGPDVSSLAGKTVRLRFVLRDADVFSYRFE